MLDMSETYYRSAHNSPPMILFDQDGKTTRTHSEISVHQQDVRNPFCRSSATQINAPESKATLDSFISKHRTTRTEISTEIDSDSACEEASDPSALANRDRLVFLARKYARRHSKEEDARLEILTETVRALLPRVTEGDFQHLAEIANEFSSIREENQKLLDKLNLS